MRRIGRAWGRLRDSESKERSHVRSFPGKEKFPGKGVGEESVLTRDHG